MLFEKERIMKGKIAAYHQNVGQVLSEGNVYNFHINCVQGSIKNHQEFDFELDEHGKVKVIYGNGADSHSGHVASDNTEDTDTEEKTFLTEEE